MPKHATRVQNMPMQLDFSDSRSPRPSPREGRGGGEKLAVGAGGSRAGQQEKFGVAGLVGDSPPKSRGDLAGRLFFFPRLRSVARSRLGGGVNLGNGFSNPPFFFQRVDPA